MGRFALAMPAEIRVTSTAIVAPMPGSVIALMVASGDRVTRGQLFVVIEAMKMEQTLSAPSRRRLALDEKCLPTRRSSKAVFSCSWKESHDGRSLLRGVDHRRPDLARDPPHGHRDGHPPFSAMTHNPQPLHIDAEAVLSQRIWPDHRQRHLALRADGWLSVGDTTHGNAGSRGYDRLVMPKPVFIGDADAERKSAISRRVAESTRGIVTFQHELINQRGGSGSPVLAHGAGAEEAGMRLRSLLFVPGDRPDRMEKALGSSADALILDLEDLVTLQAKPAARTAVASFLRSAERKARLFVRINALDSGLVEEDLAPSSTLGWTVSSCRAEGGISVAALAAMAPDRPILPIATETPAAIFQLDSYAAVRVNLAGLTWGRRICLAAIGATSACNEDGSYTQPYELALADAVQAMPPVSRDRNGLDPTPRP